jgi:homogentisate 1,2-dioxygenase
MSETNAGSLAFEGPLEAAASQAAASPPPGPPKMIAYTREGFAGAFSASEPAGYPPDYTSVVGPHAPRRWIISNITPPDESDPSALPMLLADSNKGVRLRLSGRRVRSDVIVRNVEADELHFIQEGDVKFETDAGNLTARRGDFVCLPRSTAYRCHATSGSMRSLIIESQSPFKFSTPYPVGVINFGRDLVRPTPEAVPESGPMKVLLRAWDGEDTLFTVPSNPLSMTRHMGGEVPVWKINIDQIQKLVSLPVGGPPYPFLASKNEEVLLFNLGDRPTSGYRPPIHVNADFDEIMLYIDGESAWGGCTEAGTLSWVPKGVVHHGVPASTPKPHRSWLLETMATFRWTEEAIAAGGLMETGTYGLFNPS